MGSRLSQHSTYIHHWLGAFLFLGRGAAFLCLWSDIAPPPEIKYSNSLFLVPASMLFHFPNLQFELNPLYSSSLMSPPTPQQNPYAFFALYPYGIKCGVEQNMDLDNFRPYMPPIVDRLIPMLRGFTQVMRCLQIMLLFVQDYVSLGS